ncbi:MAG TPA: HAD hydrolase family protein [Deltaproteobacteria bacterium]|nr:HAD hydrolase family protein [Deltaproteobacteria bacterium]
MRKEVQTREPRRLIVFTDLDGTLLNHGDYSWEAARPALEKTRALGIPLVICTSKTRPEVELLRAEIGVAGPFIVENGGGIFFPREYDDLPWAVPSSWTPTGASPWAFRMPGSGPSSKRPPKPLPSRASAT